MYSISHTYCIYSKCMSFSLSQFYSYDENRIQKDWQISCSCFFLFSKKKKLSIYCGICTAFALCKKKELYY